MARTRPQVFVSYSHEGEEITGPWNERVKDFVNHLRQWGGIDAVFDQYGNPLNRHWDLWGPTAIRKAETIVCLASPQYALDWEVAAGSGVSDEARSIREALTDGKGILFAVLPGRSRGDIPHGMRGLHSVAVPSIDNAGLEEIVRLLTDQPLILKPDLGNIPDLPPA